MKNNKVVLCHSAQQLDNLSQDIISIGEKQLDISQDKIERQKVIAKIEEVNSSESKEISKLSQVSIQYTSSNFVVQTIPEERDGYGRLAPILSYGEFPDEEINDQEGAWIKEVSNDIMRFAQSIQLTLTQDTQEVIENLLRKVLNNMRQKKIQEESWKEVRLFLITFGVAIVVPVGLGWLIYQQIPQIVNTFIQENLQQTLILSLQEILQKLILWLMWFIAINNAILILILKLPSLLMIRHRYYKMKKKIMTNESQMY